MRSVRRRARSSDVGGFCLEPMEVNATGDQESRPQVQKDEAKMSWTDERVELLRQLWLDGRSASQISAELGLGITRNAVIGKVHRLGLSGRAKSATPATPRVRQRPAPQPRATVASRSSSGGGGGHVVRGNTALAF